MFDILLPPFPNNRKKALADMIYTVLNYIELYHDQIKMSLPVDEELQALATALNLAFQNPRIAKRLLKSYFPDVRVIECQNF